MVNKTLNKKNDPIEFIINRLIDINQNDKKTLLEVFENDENIRLKEEINKLIKNLTLKANEAKTTSERFDSTIKELQKAYYIIKKSSIVLFEWTLREDIPTTYVSENIKNFGYDREEFYTGELKDYWNFVYIEDREKTKKRINSSREKKLEELFHKYRVVCKNGEIRWVEEWMIHEKDESGELVSERGVLRDITDQMKMAEKLKISENRYQKLFENTSALVFLFNLNGDIVEANKAFTDIFGKDEKNFFNLDLSLMNQEIKGKNMDFFKILSFLKDNPGEILEYSVYNLFGEKIILEVRFNVIYENGKPIEIQGIGQDISYRKEAEKRLKYISEHDRLTGLYNREYFDRKAEEINEKKEFPFSVVIGDMNGLKITNDAFGHSKGDELIFNMAKIFKFVANKNDMVCRLGGDEFAIIMKNCDEEKALEFCEKVKDMCSKSKLLPIKPSIALGCSTKYSYESKFSEIYKEADDRMYKNKIKEMAITRGELLSALRKSLANKEYESLKHSDRIKNIAVEIAEKVGLNESKLREIVLASEMHDIGKISIQDSILFKKEKLTKYEWEVIKKHSEHGYHILLSTPNLATVAEFVLYHHERWDGKGYPKGLIGLDIPLVSRIIAISDSYEALTHKRIYRKKMSKKEAIDEIKRCSGTQFDPELVNIFVTIMEGKWVN